MSPRDWSPVKTSSPRQQSEQDQWNQMSPLHNLTLLQPRFKLLILSGQRRMTLFRHTISSSKYCKADVKPPSFISSWCKAALKQFALLKRYTNNSDVTCLVSWKLGRIKCISSKNKIIQIRNNNLCRIYSTLIPARKQILTWNASLRMKQSKLLALLKPAPHSLSPLRTSSGFYSVISRDALPFTASSCPRPQGPNQQPAPPQRIDTSPAQSTGPDPGYNHRI